MRALDYIQQSPPTLTLTTNPDGLYQVRIGSQPLYVGPSRDTAEEVMGRAWDILPREWRGSPLTKKRAPLRALDPG